MAKEPKQEEMDQVLFSSLVFMLSTAVMQNLGKLMNPVTGKSETDLASAQATIDMLEMLARKTKGNLDANEERLLTQTLSMLQMNFVEAFDSGGAQASAPEADNASGAEKSAPQDGESAAGAKTSADEKPTVEDASKTGADKEPRFRKSYGEK